jgi:hypothetical protein
MTPSLARIQPDQRKSRRSRAEDVDQRPPGGCRPKKRVCKSVVDELDSALLVDPRPALPNNSEQMYEPTKDRI